MRVTAIVRKAFADGIGWGDAKQQLFERIDRDVAPLREKYETLMAEPAKIDPAIELLWRLCAMLHRLGKLKR